MAYYEDGHCFGGKEHLRTGDLVVSPGRDDGPAPGLNVVVRRVYNATDPESPTRRGRGGGLSVSDVHAGLEGCRAW